MFVRSSGDLSPARNEPGARLRGLTLIAPAIAGPRLDRTRAVRASLRLAGFAVLCDWIGSNKNWFHYQEADAFESLAHYWA
jgi:hypothetical protein